MIRKAVFALLWFPVLVVLLIVNLTMLVNSHGEPVFAGSAPAYLDSNLHVAAHSGSAQVLGRQITAGDAREMLVRRFLERHNSPMAPFAGDLVATADKYELDFRLLPAIAMCESNAGKHMPKKDEYNAWGIAVYTGQIQGAKFDSWPNAITYAGKLLRERYIDQGLTDLISMGARWAPPSVEKGNSWAKCVQSFQDQIL